ncbi:MAG: hypothetical protein M3Y53_07545, partial [Thermoproteota archaeon]|nr:hypothetical protein [Thermoproteota archaeon]
MKDEKKVTMKNG